MQGKRRASGWLYACGVDVAASRVSAPPPVKFFRTAGKDPTRPRLQHTPLRRIVRSARGRRRGRLDAPAERSHRLRGVQFDASLRDRPPEHARESIQRVDLRTIQVGEVMSLTAGVRQYGGNGQRGIDVVRREDLL